jgi:hypothetical protein
MFQGSVWETSAKLTVRDGGAGEVQAVREGANEQQQRQACAVNATSNAIMLRLHNTREIRATAVMRSQFWIHQYCTVLPNYWRAAM